MLYLMSFLDAENHLCRWHISRNVLAHCKKYFETKEVWDSFICNWNSLVMSFTEEEYLHNLIDFDKSFVGNHEALDYVKGTWLNKHK